MWQRKRSLMYKHYPWRVKGPKTKKKEKRGARQCRHVHAAILRLSIPHCCPDQSLCRWGVRIYTCPHQSPMQCKSEHRRLCIPARSKIMVSLAPLPKAIKTVPLGKLSCSLFRGCVRRLMGKDLDEAEMQSGDHYALHRLLA